MPESGRAISIADPLGVENWALMVGTGSTLRPFTVKDVIEGVVEVYTALVAGSLLWWAESGVAGLCDLLTFARCPTQ